MPQIVYIDITATATEAPNNLQGTGAIVSVGGTNLTDGSYQLITSVSDFTAIASTASGEVYNCVNSFYQQGEGSVYVLELGAGATLSDALNTYIQANPKTFYAYLLGASAASDSGLVTMAKNYVNQNSMTYFFLDCTYAQAQTFANIKSVATFIPSPSAVATEIDAGGAFYELINANPNSTKKLAPFAFRYMYGKTPWAEKGNAAQFARMKSLFANFIGTGAQGGVSEDILFWGYFMDGKPMSYWYAVDWVQIHLAQDLAYEIITGSNNTTNPLIYDQRGITRLQARALSTLSNGVNYGCIISSPTVAAVDFGTYIAANPTDYSTGTYNGLSATIEPMRGFEQITFYLNVDFTGAAAATTTTTG